jgi:sterol desaturase/sphingolipid hydroxylase (fatty acid hydroxylase superfamily)
VISNKLIYYFSQSKINLLSSFVLDTLIGFTLLIYAFTLEYDLTFMIATIFIGWLGFTLIEYMVHAWLFHIGNNVIVKGHAQHHRAPQGYDNLPFFASYIIAGSIYLVIENFIPQVYAIAFVSMLLISYVMYTLFHYLMHRVDFKTPYFLYMQRFHYIHHMRPKKNHGVTTPIWDFVFRTYEPLSLHQKYFQDDLKLKPSDDKIVEG